jgi:hypothetical protein
MDWKSILRQAKTGDPVELDGAALDDDTLERLPEDASLLLHGDPTYWIGRDGTTAHVRIEWMCRSGFWEHKFNLPIFDEARG